MLSGSLGLQIIFRRLGVELGEQQFSKIKGVDERELTFREIKNLKINGSISSTAMITNNFIEKNGEDLFIPLDQSPFRD